MQSQRLTSLEENPFNRNQYLCRLNDPTVISAVSKGNELRDLPGVRWVSANFLCQTVPSSLPSDNYLPTQWYIPQIQADSAWLVANPNAGSFRVAVVDDGVASHLDLPAARKVPGWDAIGSYFKHPNPDNDPSPGYWRAHGMKCMGVLAASINDTGIVGVDPWCEIVPIKIFDDYGVSIDNWRRALAIDSAVHCGAKVISCSWTVQPGTPTADLEEAIINAVDSTYAGIPYGCVVVFGSGNDGDTVCFPANMEQVISVGAVNSSDVRTSYSNYGMAIDIMAPSDVSADYCVSNLMSTDQMGSPGINPDDGDCLNPDISDVDYTRHFSGTSAACPQVSAVAALILSRRPDLIQPKPEMIWDTTTSEKVKYILYNSAKDLGTTGWDQYYGHGRVNAYRALLSVIRGDINNDGFIDSIDLSILIDMMYYGGHSTLDDRTADCNCDGVLADAVDLSYLVDVIFFGAEIPICFKF